MSSNTAKEFGLTEGSFVWIETHKGSARFVVKVAKMRDGVVSVEYGWWYPEWTGIDSCLSGAWVANANILTGADYEECDLLVGTATYNGISCRITPD